MKEGGITRSTGFQILLYLGLALSAFGACFCSLMTVWLWNFGGNEVSFKEFEKRLMSTEVYEHVGYICEDSYSFVTLKDMYRAFTAESAANNVRYAVFDIESNKCIWTNASIGLREGGNAYEFWFIRPANAGSDAVEQYKEYKVYTYVDPSMMLYDDFRDLHQLAAYWYYRLNWLYVGAGCSFLVFFICLVWLMCNAGHRWHKEGIVPGIFCSIYFDIFTAVWGVLFLGYLSFAFVFAEEFLAYRADVVLICAGISVLTALGIVWCGVYLREFALRLKLGGWWRHTALWQLCKAGKHLLQFGWKCLVKLVAMLPEIHLVVIALAVLSFFEFLEVFDIATTGREDLFVLWFLEKLIVVPVILYCAVSFARLRKGSRALANGELSQSLNTKYLYLHFKEHAKDLNQIGTGISKAVEERIKSERMKTELITNVSHDLKTPLTSVINYADLLAVAAGGEGADKDAQIQEYSEVLLRQAGRLKKLLEDLVEASKAATGNVEISLMPCELGVILTQVAGEYEERLNEKQLKLIVKKPEEEIRILADGRQLWRVVENLMNNICKYAQEGSRVYLTMEAKDKRVELVFRNMSKYELDVDATELTERFVRGDSSRHMEGSGLGLSIAKSLTELQNGRMEILTDGDLFKVILSFEVCE